MSNKQEPGTRKARVKGTDRIVDVYKLQKKGTNSAGGQVTEWQIFLGEKLTMAAIDAGSHNEKFTEDQLEFI